MEIIESFVCPTASAATPPAGNRSTVTTGGSPTSYSANVLNQYVGISGVVPTYDGNGNLTSDGSATYTYDSENHLRQAITAGVTSTYTYDPLGRRLTKTVGGVTTRFLYDGDQIVAETTAAGTLQATYLYGAGIDEPLRMIRGGTTSYYHADGLGSVTTLTNTSGAVVERAAYDAYGQTQLTNAAGTVIANSTVGNRLGFTGRELDAETGLYYYRARIYSPALGRFLQRDPIGYTSDLNPYRYTANNPTLFSDPFGLDYWIEGPSPGEPGGHQSINVGDPNGEYTSYSFGVNMRFNVEHGIEGEVYRDPMHGGRIDPNFYRKTDPYQDQMMKSLLEGEVGHRDWYSPTSTCRNYSQSRFERFVEEGYGATSNPPARPVLPNTPSSQVPRVSSTITSSEPYGIPSRTSNRPKCPK